MVERDAEVVLRKNEARAAGDNVGRREQDDGAADAGDSREGGPPLPHKVCAFGIPWGHGEGVDVRRPVDAVGLWRVLADDDDRG